MMKGLAPMPFAYAHALLKGPMKASKDVINQIVFVLLIAFIGWNLFRLGLMVFAANSLL